MRKGSCPAPPGHSSESRSPTRLAECICSLETWSRCQKCTLRKGDRPPHQTEIYAVVIQWSSVGVSGLCVSDARMICAPQSLSSVTGSLLDPLAFGPVVEAVLSPDLATLSNKSKIVPSRQNSATWRDKKKEPLKVAWDPHREQFPGS